LDRGVACLRWIHPRGGLGAAVRAPAHDAQSGRAAVASYREGRAAWSRNPMYLSLTIIYADIALALGKSCPSVFVVLPWAAMNWIVIPFEESRLRKAFGQDYADYCQGVRRWL
jgi:protein-S-isoprenylcysteine O-methyltransferase Ste14